MINRKKRHEIEKQKKVIDKNKLEKEGKKLAREGIDYMLDKEILKGEK